MKGILTAEDALIGVEMGAKGILVSNHGARQVDGTPASVSSRYLVKLIIIFTKFDRLKPCRKL